MKSAAILRQLGEFSFKNYSEGFLRPRALMGVGHRGVPQIVSVSVSVWLFLALYK